RSIGRDAVDEVERARTRYNADRAVVVTNSRPDGAAIKRGNALSTIGIKIEFWTGLHLPKLYAAIPERVPGKIKLREYQVEAVAAIEDALETRRRALLVLATGLGKSVVAGEVISRWLLLNPQDPILVVATMKDLVQQLERSVWRHLPKMFSTQVLTGGSKPTSFEGVTFATLQSTGLLSEIGYRPALLIVDETHHLGSDGQMVELLERHSSAAQVGLTATPWRGDGYDVSQYFGRACYSLGIADGMAKGYLANVDYRLYTDRIDWGLVTAASKEGYTLKDLNSRLFLPQRDEQIAELLWEVWSAEANPRGIIFCQSVEHAERMRSFLSRYCGAWANACCLHAGLPKRERDVILGRFRLGSVSLIVAVDILNEGVDIPDVNIIGFLRVTHSRRIFVQQLGRGLRLSEGKQRVTVLDFVTDIRRVAAVLNLRRELAHYSGALETLELRPPSEVGFADPQLDSFMEAWLRDVGDLENSLDDARLNFPEVLRT
ncbi:MAG: DEAD/DEAH box helicase family protein, partial [Candidatus Eremiobacteraeota bacterium]|nr:DEAD/DEAH box helicase family protein [Candidatus Eremiobacteraeota bacterium]